MSCDPAISVLAFICLYFYFNAYNAMRQYWAVGFVLCAYCCLRENKWFLAILLEIVAVGIHTPAVVCLLLLSADYIRRHNEKKRVLGTYRKPRVANIMGLLVVLLVMELAFAPMMQIIFKIFPMYEYYSRKASFAGVRALREQIIYTSIFIAYTVLSEDNEWTIPMDYAVCLAFAISRVSYMRRPLWYFDIFSIFAIAEIWHTKLLTGKMLKILRASMVFCLLAFVIYYLHAGGMRVTPYKMFFA